MPKQTRLLSDEKIIALYQDGMEYKELAPLAGISDRAIRDVLYKNSVEIRPRYRKHKVNENFFETWTNEMAYVFGLLITDGCVSGNSLSFSQKDEKLLRLVAKHMKADYVVVPPSKTRNVSTLLINSKKIVEDIYMLGLTERKSLTMKFPKVPDKFLPHFIRGVIDGNGWVQNTGYMMSIVSGSEKFANGLKETFELWQLNTYVKNEKSKNNTMLYRIFVSGKGDIVNLAKIIYNNCDDNFVIHKRARMSQRLIGSSSFVESRGEIEMWKVENGRLAHTTDVSRKHFRTSISKATLDSFEELAKENNTHVNYLIENGLKNMFAQEDVVIQKKLKAKDRIQYHTTYDIELLERVRGFAKEEKVNINDVLEKSLEFVDPKEERDVSYRYRIEK